MLLSRYVPAERRSVAGEGTSFPLLASPSSRAFRCWLLVCALFVPALLVPSTIYAATPPTVTTQPEGGAFCEGDTLSLTVAGTSTEGAIGYQWRLDGINLAGETASTLTITDLVPADSGTYDVVLTNLCGSTTSDGVVVAVTASTIAFLTNPTDSDNCVGDSIVLSASVTAPGAVTYQWRKDGVDLPGETGATLTLNSLTASDAGSYDVLVTDVTTPPATGDVQIATGTFVTPAGTGISSVISGLGFTPKALMLRGVAVQDELVNAGLTQHFGFVDGAGNHRSVNLTSVNGAGDTLRQRNETDVLSIILPGVDAPVVSATLSSFDVGGVSLDFSNASAGYVVHYVAFGGADLQATVGTSDANASPITGLAFSPDLVFTSTIGLGPVGTGTQSGLDYAVQSHGVLASGGEHFAGVYAGENTAGTASIHSTLFDGEFIGQLSPGILEWGLASSAINADGWSWTGTNGDAFYYLALDTDDRGVAVGTFVKDATGVDGATQNLPDLGFTPQVVGLSTGGKPNSGVSPTGLVLSHGATDGTNTHATLITQPASTTNADQRQDDDHAILIGNTNAVIDAAATVGVFDDSTPELTWSPNDTAATIVGYWAVEAAQAPACTTLASAVAIVEVSAGPTILTDPVGVTLCEGGAVNLSVTVDSLFAPTYQWRKDGSNIAGATSDTLVLDPALASDSGNYDVVVTTVCGSATSAAASVVVQALPSITADPISQTLCEGLPVTLSVSAASTLPLSYQWRKDGGNIAGATGASLTIDPVTPADAGSYDVVVTNDCGSVTSGAASITVDLLPTISTQPATQTVCDGSDVTFTVVAAGTAPLSYQWRKDGSNIAGATGTSLALTAVTASDSGSYDVVVTNLCGSLTSSAATLTVQDPPAISVDPADTTVCEGDPITLSVTATGTAPLDYQWRRGGANLAGETADTLSIAAATATDAGAYDVVVTNSCGSASSATATVTVQFAPAISTAPASTTACEGASATLSVTATGTAPLTYQWQKGGTDVAGATASTLELNPLEIADAGDYTVIVSNGCGAATSSAATVTVDALPTISADPTDVTVCTGDAILLSVTASGAAPLGYQWRKDGSDLAGETGTTLSIAAAVTGDAGSYDVVVSNGCATITSAAATVTVNTPPSIDTEPTGATVCEGANVVLTVAASGTGPLNYQWRKGGVDVAGATAATLNLNAITPADAGDYDVVVTNACDSATSATATVVVNSPAVISTQPTGATVCTGDAILLSVTVTGTAPIDYQWRKAGVDLAGETGATLSIAAALVGDAGSYDVVVSNVCATVTSDAAVVVVNTPPTIDTEPTGTTVCEGAEVILSVAASGTGPLSYQWRQDGSDVAGATSATLTLSAITPAEAGDYDVVITNLCGTATSALASVVVNSPAVIATQPTGATVCTGDAILLSVTATGTAPIDYQWRKDGVDLAGETGATLSIVAAATGDAGSYDVVVSNICATVTSDAAVVVVNTPPTIDTEPADTTVCEGANVVLTVAASGTAPIDYQWREDGVDLAGETGATLTLNAITPAEAGAYEVVVSNVCATVTSATATITVEVPPAITADPTGVTVCAGDPITLTVATTGTAPLSYKWQLGGVDVAGATSDTLSIASALTTDAGSYTVIVSNNCGTVTSAAAVVTVNESPSITTQPLSQGVCQNGAVTFSVVATGTAPLTYQWRKDGVNLVGETNDTLDVTVSGAAEGGVYDVVVTNLCGSLTSDGATLTVDLLPTIDTQPVGTTLCEGATLTLSVVVTPAAGASYQWSLGGTEIAGATDATYEVASTTVADAGDYSVVATNSCGSVTSDTVTVVVETAPALSTDVVDQTVCTGDVLLLEVVAVGTPPLTYQWSQDGVDIPGATSATLDLGTADLAEAGNYVVTIDNGCGTLASSTAAITVNDAPTIDTDPIGVTLCAGEAIVLSTAASGIPAPTLQWRKDGIDIAGATAANLTIDPAVVGDAGAYDVVATNVCGSATSATATVVVLTPVTIDTQPVGSAACVGDSVVLSVTATGSAPLDYQWLKDGAAIGGATLASLTLDPIALGDAGVYTVEVGNACGVMTSDAAALTVEDAPSIDVEPVGALLCAGDPFTLEVVATAPIVVNYQWRLDGVDIPGATATSYSVMASTPSDAGVYTVVVSNACGSVTSAAAAVQVDETVSIDASPASSAVVAGDDIVLSVTATGGGLGYQWRRDGLDLAGETAATLSLTAVDAVDAGVYDVVVTNACGSDTSAAATISVTDLATDLALTCCNVDGTSSICWTTTEIYESYEILRDGVVVGTADGIDACFEEALTLPGSYDYSVVGIASGGLLRSAEIVCSVEVVDAPTDLTCVSTDVGGGLVDVLVTWTSNGTYDGLNIYRDDVLVAVVMIDFGSFSDVGLADGTYVYRVEGFVTSTGCDSTATSAECTNSDFLPSFVRGDSNGDVLVNIADIVFTIQWLLNDGAEPGCFDAADANDDGMNDVADTVFTINYQFQGGPEPPAPGPFGCGVDPQDDPDSIGCIDPPDCP